MFLSIAAFAKKKGVQIVFYLGKEGSFKNVLGVMVIFTASDVVARIVPIIYRRYKIKLTAVVHLAC